MKKGIFIAIIVGVLLAGIIGGIFLYKYIITPTLDNLETQENSENNSDNNSNESQTDIENDTKAEENNTNQQESQSAKIIIEDPQANDKINGKFLVTGKALATLQVITIQVYDDSNNLLGQAIADLASGDPNPMHGIYQEIQMDKSPISKNGILIAYPADQGIDSADKVEVEISFMPSTSQDRLIVYSPINGMYFNGGEITMWGKMHDFFEGTGYVKLLNETGGTLWEGSFTSKSDNYSQFADFENTFVIGQIPLAAGDNGKWVFYDVSMMDGTTQILLEIPVQIN